MVCWNVNPFVAWSGSLREEAMSSSDRAIARLWFREKLEIGLVSSPFMNIAYLLKGLVACGCLVHVMWCYVVCYVSEHTSANIMISDRLYRLLLSSGITFGGLGVAWILMKAIVPSKEEMLKVFTCEVFFSVI